MATKVLVPLLGEGVEEVTVTKWLKQEGETINELEPLLEVNTDKVDTEIPAPASGTILKIVAQEGLAARVGEILAFIGKPGELMESAGNHSVKYEANSTAQNLPIGPRGNPQPGTERNKGFISPVVARMVAEHGLDLSKLQGTGVNGRITKIDVLNFVQMAKSGILDENPEQIATAQSGVPHAASAGDRLIKHTVIRRQIAEHMLLSHKTSPHVLTVMEADMSRVTAHRDANKAAFELQGVKLTFTAYLIGAIVAGLKAYPITNSSWTEEGVFVHGAVNIGMATSLGEEGLIVPVIKHADNLSLLAIARAVNDLANRARARKLQPDDVRGGTFTLTNHGIGGSLFAMPIINQPQCAILGTGAIQKRVVAVLDANGNDAFSVRPMLFLSLVFDHRILDGASADAFLMKVRQTLEAWS